jgi:predicted XRE-type DNA-binding protein
MQETFNHYRKLMRARGFTGEEAETLVHKVALIAEIKATIEENGWSQLDACKRLGVKQSRLSELNHTCIDKFSTDLLIKYLYRLKKLVHVILVDAPQKRVDPMTTARRSR